MTEPARAEIAALFTTPVAVACRRGAFDGACPFPEEAALMAGAAPRRRAEFAAGRLCAHEAIGRLGERPSPILVGPDRAPRWPAGLLGSITHCEGFVAAVAARVGEAVALGLDAEVAASLTPEVLSLVVTATEAEHHAALHLAAPWGALAFSAKEAFYKAYASLAPVRLSFHEVEIAFRVEDDAGGAFQARVIPPEKQLARGGVAVEGRWRMSGPLVYAGATARSTD